MKSEMKEGCFVSFSTTWSDERFVGIWVLTDFDSITGAKLARVETSRNGYPFGVEYVPVDKLEHDPGCDCKGRCKS